MNIIIKFKIKTTNQKSVWRFSKKKNLFLFGKMKPTFYQNMNKLLSFRRKQMSVVFSI